MSDRFNALRFNYIMARKDLAAAVAAEEFDVAIAEHDTEVIGRPPEWSAPPPVPTRPTPLVKVTKIP